MYAGQFVVSFYHEHSWLLRSDLQVESRGYFSEWSEQTVEVLVWRYQYEVISIYFVPQVAVNTIKIYLSQDVLYIKEGWAYCWALMHTVCEAAELIRTCLEGEAVMQFLQETWYMYRYRLWAQIYLFKWFLYSITFSKNYQISSNIF